MTTPKLSHKTVLDLQKLVSKVNALIEAAKDITAQQNLKAVEFTIAGAHTEQLLVLLQNQLSELDIKSAFMGNSSLYVQQGKCSIIIPVTI